ncbi:class V chitinase CHIT5b [Cicer arietinum]|uniref:Class V chitinase n=1 Tax=Cicer arietinum TaxID=3827 RepID=A0A1S2YQL8_CICAR|nr:class V chitinase [Cicer arietinum]
MASLKIFLTLAILLTIATKTSTCTSSLSLSSSSSSSSTRVKGIYWIENPLFPPSSINTSLFTHIFYAFITPDNVTYKLQPSTSQTTSFTIFTNTFKTKTPPATTLLSIGGAGSNSTLFTIIASNATARAAFINSTIDVARTFGFDGIDFDWEFPKTSNEMNSLGELFLQWRNAIAAESSVTGKPPLLLTAAVYFAASFFLSGEPRTYPVDSINKNLDWINVMSYDLHVSTSNETGAPSGMFDPKSNVTVSSGLISWIRVGVLPEKLVMGMPLYGKTWQLEDPKVNEIGSPSVGAGPGMDGSMAYFQVLEFIKLTRAKVVYDVDTVSVYTYSGSTWIGYDDPFTVSIKIGFAQAFSLRGYFFWVAGLDTFDWKISTQASKAWL